MRKWLAVVAAILLLGASPKKLQKLEAEMGTPRIEYTASSGVPVVINFPEHPNRIHASQIIKTDSERTPGGVEYKSLLSIYDLVRVQMDGISDQPFIDAMHAFYAHAGAGGSFSFFEDGADGLREVCTLSVADAAAGTRDISLDGESLDFDISNRSYRFFALAVPAVEIVEIVSIYFSPPPEYRLRGNLAYDHKIGDPFLSLGAYSNCVLLSDEAIIQKVPGGTHSLFMYFKSNSEFTVP